MGMDVHGLNPKENKNIDDFPIIKKYNKMKCEDKWKELGADDNLQKMYWKEQEDWEASNPGVYFRNNVWWWRPLWNYCYAIADDIISEDVFENGHSNSGAGLNDKDAKLLGNRLMETIADGTAIRYQADYLQHMEDSDDEFANSYPFDVDNVEAFALFCIESGGFEIC
jgi:hypothetical protein